MTPGARLSAASAVLDRILTGSPPETALTGWGRANRFAGSGDRHAIRDLVFDALRCRRSHAALGGGLTGRGLILGGLRAAGRDPAEMFTGLGHAPYPVRPDEAGHHPQGAEALDVPDWLEARLQAALGSDYTATMRAMQRRAPVYLRVNIPRATREEAIRRLAADGIQSQAVDFVNTALQVTGNARKIQTSPTYLQGLVELQDAASQAVVALLDAKPGHRVLDYCAGGGGKSLALAARGVTVDAHDISLARMVDLPERARRAIAKVRIVENPASSAPYDLILVDAPCSGSGSWRRDPQGKWALTSDRLGDLLRLQADLLDHVVTLLHPQGTLAYATCSMLRAENEDQVHLFRARHPDFRVGLERRFSPLQGGDGFFVATLTRENAQYTQP